MARKFNINSKEIELPHQQGQILIRLMNCHHRVVTLDELCDVIKHDGNNPVRHDVENAISKLRNNLRFIGEEKSITTVNGVGYQWIQK